MEKSQHDYDLYEFFHWYDQFQRPCYLTTNPKRKRKENEMFSTSQHDCNIDDDETNSSNDQGICNDPETPTPNNIRKSSPVHSSIKTCFDT